MRPATASLPLCPLCLSLSLCLARSLTRSVARFLLPPASVASRGRCGRGTFASAYGLLAERRRNLPPRQCHAHAKPSSLTLTPTHSSYFLVRGGWRLVVLSPSFAMSTRREKSKGRRLETGQLRCTTVIRYSTSLKARLGSGAPSEQAVRLARLRAFAAMASTYSTVLYCPGAASHLPPVLSIYEYRTVPSSARAPHSVRAHTVG